MVGAGFAGLAAARELTRRGHDVLVLEGRDRVGGRSHTGAVAGVPVDLGGTFVGPTQDAVLGLAAELAVPTVPTYHHGANRIRWRGRVRSYRGTIPKLSLPGLLDIARVRWQFERIARAVPLVEPWAARRAEELDSQSLGGWLRSVHAGASTRDLLAIMAGSLGAVSPTTCRCCTRPGTCAPPADWTGYSTSKAARSRTASRPAPSRSPRSRRPSWASAWCWMLRYPASTSTVAV
ncbi:flavin containing amine oxidoreductase family protein [Mycobacterium xenopi 4042]|uniref:Flavin containing amine oxidoreductase family protein n=1 Tax=Mycobacterium xenopi 4042 TaxID=1299334 RepID=X7YKN9_MYCXE|nr:flavin containing amine oxidoreductase family protein [Mycobacterium xenopi 4042]